VGSWAKPLSLDLLGAVAVVRGQATAPCHPVKSHPVKSRPVTRAVARWEVADRAVGPYERGPHRGLRNHPRQRGSQGRDTGGDLRQRIEQADEGGDLLLGAVFGVSEDLQEIVFGEVGPEQQKAGEMELAGRNGVEQGWEAPDQARGGDAAIGFVLGAAENRRCSRCRGSSRREYGGYPWLRPRRGERGGRPEPGSSGRRGRA